MKKKHFKEWKTYIKTANMKNKNFSICRLSRRAKRPSLCDLHEGNPAKVSRQHEQKFFHKYLLAAYEWMIEAGAKSFDK